HQRGFPISEQTRALCGVFNRTTEREGFNYAGKEVGGGWMWKGHRDRVEWLYWYWEEGTRMRKVRLRVLKEERGMRGEVEGWGNREKGEKDGGVVKEENGDGLSDEEREMVERLEAEMEEEEHVASEVKLDVKSEIDEEPKPKIQEEMTVEDMIKEELTDTATWAAKIGDVDEWWKSLKRKRESDPGGSSI
ncbi:MAG: hypothetical protein Q9188_003507, partial [Gyalolechia gomerana]